MHTRKLRTLAITAGLAIVALLGIQGTASADSVSDSKLLTMGSSQFFSFGAFGSPWKVGDCHLEPDSWVAIEGNVVHLHATSDTDFTKGADIWHSRFVFNDANQRTVLSVTSSAFDSPRMVPSDGRSSGASDIYVWDRFVRVTSGIPGGIFSVRWFSSC
ncbi:hypothetical protein [Sphaerisporangium corydalis]|uniref:Uncharacterized protein n=1 Tax=Sphaerisporangium corydalis TaxID=1441875 RepID=A0ABV9EMD1_9ACTN|nr:hypothetical protein [Sphaerisporangium corydalis]